jgi:hypothetical protein
MAPRRATTFGARVIDFYRALRAPDLQHLDVDSLFPFRDPQVWAAVETFYTRFFHDKAPRRFIIGINPGRFGGGITGIPFTDPVSLERQCGIANPFAKRRELSAEFIEALIDRLGGPADFYGRNFITAVSPVGFTRHGKNFNYYDDPRVVAALEPFIISAFRTQLEFGARRDLGIVLGTGKNFRYVEHLNATHRFFDRLIAVEHPRFIMQYRRPHVKRYLSSYERVLAEPKARVRPTARS